MADTQIVGYTVQLPNNKAALEMVRSILESGLKETAAKNSLTLIGDDRDEIIEYGSFIETGESYLDEDGIEVPMTTWQETIEDRATYARITWEGRAK